MLSALHQSAVLHVPSSRQSVSLPFLFPMYGKPGIRLSHRFPESPLGILLDDLHFERVDIHTVRLVCPDTSYRYDIPTCNACFPMFDFLLRRAPESHLPEAHDSHKASDADNHKRLRDISLHTKSSSVPYLPDQWQAPFAGIPFPDDRVALHLHTWHSIRRQEAKVILSCFLTGMPDAPLF